MSVCSVGVAAGRAPDGLQVDTDVPERGARTAKATPSHDVLARLDASELGQPVRHMDVRAVQDPRH